MSISNELISLREASKLSGYHSDYLSFLIRSNKLKGHRVGRMWVVYKSDFENFLKNKENPQKSPSNFFQKLSRAIFTTFLVAFFVFITVQILKNPESGKKVANNITYQK